MNELTINLDSRSKKPLYEQIYDYIKSDICLLYTSDAADEL